MSKYHSLLLEKLRSENKEAPKKPYYLFFLGTAVNFVAKPDTAEVASYIRGETWSFGAQLTAKLLGEEGQELTGHSDYKHENYAHAYHSDSVDVINGPNTPGDQAGDRIAKGLLLALQAIANGQTEINLSGFSRGSVEAIVLTNELKRVKDMLEADQSSDKKRTLVDILQDTSSVPGVWPFGPTSYTQQALNKLLNDKPEKNDDEEKLKEALLNGLNQLEINLFVLDPVPGGNFAKLPVGWDEPSFYTLPDFVKKKLELVQQHETSNCFKAIIPKDMPYEVIPGCHGTGDGNQFDDNGNPIDAETKNVSGVQNLVIQRWLEFMSFKVDNKELTEELVPDHKELNEVAFKYLKAQPEVRDELLLESYMKIMDNYPAFTFLAGKCYNGLGQFGPERHIHYHKHGSIPITDIHPHGKSDSFVNKQHVQLWIAQMISSFNFVDLPLEEQVAWIKDNIAFAFQEVEKVEIVSTDELSKSVLKTQNQLNAILEMTNDSKKAKILVDALAMLSNTLILTYLRNHLEQGQLEACHEYFAKTIEILEHAASDNSSLKPEKKQTAKNFKEVIQDGLTTNLHQHSRALISQSQRLFEDSIKLLVKVDNEEVQEERQEDEDNKIGLRQVRQQQALAWLINTQTFISELKTLSSQVGLLAPFCKQEELINWTLD